MSTPVVALAAELIRIPSVNPEGDPGVDSPGEAAIAEFLAEWLRRHGAEVECQEVLPGRPNVVARFPSDAPGKPRLLLAPHTDTVSVVGMTIDPFGGEVRDGRLWGRGASDTKGPMAAMLTAIAALGDDIRKLDHEIWFAGLMGEEAGLHGSRALAARETFDFVIAGEPTRLEVVHAHKGSARWTLHAKGRAAHSATPEVGSNAIDLAMRAVAWLHDAFDRLGTRDPLLGPATLSVGTIRGGTKVNIVPDSCVVEVDIRTVPAFDPATLLEAFRVAWPDVDVAESVAPPLNTPSSHPMVTKLAGEAAGLATAPWFCDAAAFAATGVAAVAIGPGSIGQAHTADEFIAIDDLVSGARFFEAFLRGLRPV